jgi:hypothetical protein
MDLTEGSETSAKLNLTPGKYPKENIQIKNLCITLFIIQFNQNIPDETDTHTAAQ